VSPQSPSAHPPAAQVTVAAAPSPASTQPVTTAAPLAHAATPAPLHAAEPAPAHDAGELKHRIVRLEQTVATLQDMIKTLCRVQMESDRKAIEEIEKQVRRL
jgi:TolA-binding protein